MEKPTHAKPSLYAFYFDIAKEIGVQYGYNIVLHGSMNRDLDLIAIPWGDTLGDKMEMLDKIAEAIGGYILSESEEDRNKFRTRKHGRDCYIININRTVQGKFNGMMTSFEHYADPQYYIDISILPVGVEDKPKELTTFEAALVGFIMRMIEDCNSPRKEREAESMQKMLDMYNKNFCLRSGEIIKKGKNEK